MNPTPDDGAQAIGPISDSDLLIFRQRTESRHDFEDVAWTAGLLRSVLARLTAAEQRAAVFRRTIVDAIVELGGGATDKASDQFICGLPHECAAHMKRLTAETAAREEGFALARTRLAEIHDIAKERDDLRAKLAEMAAERTRNQVMAEGAARERDEAIARADKLAAVVRLNASSAVAYAEMGGKLQAVTAERDAHAATIARLRADMAPLLEKLDDFLVWRVSREGRSDGEAIVAKFRAAIAANPEANSGVGGAYRLGTRMGSGSPCIMGEFEEPPHDGPVPHARSRVICTFHGDDLVPLAERIVALLNGTTIDAPPTQADAGEGAAGVEG